MAAARAVAIQSDGKIVVTGSSFNSLGSFMLIRYNSNGSLDTNFAGSGSAVIPVMSLYTLAPARVALDTGGNIVAAGFSQYQSIVTRYSSVGAPDTTFASSGKIILTSGTYWGSA